MPTPPKDTTPRTESKLDSHSTARTESQHEPKEHSSTGRIVHDSRGNAVWSWGKSNDPGATGTTSTMLRKLHLENLRVESDTQSQKQPDAKKPGSGYGPGYNPYDRTAPVRVVPKKTPSR